MIRSIVITLTILIGMVEGCALPSERRLAKYPRLVTARNVLAEAREFIVAPVRPALLSLGVTQSWTLFPVASKQRYRMWIEARTTPDASWEIVYRPQDPEHQMFADTLQYRRLRGVWNPGTYQPRAGYTAFCSWIAHEVFLEAPHYSEVRVRMQHVRILLGGFEAQEQFSFEEIRRKSEVGL